MKRGQCGEPPVYITNKNRHGECIIFHSIGIRWIEKDPENEAESGILKSKSENNTTTRYDSEDDAPWALSTTTAASLLVDHYFGARDIRKLKGQRRKPIQIPRMKVHDPKPKDSTSSI
jgi:hypothetical protein